MTTDTSAMNELDCLSVWAASVTGYADPNANMLGHLRSITQFNIPSITNINQMNYLACLRSLVGVIVANDTSNMNALACLRTIYTYAYSSPQEANPSRMNALACLRGIVSFL